MIEVIAHHINFDVIEKVRLSILGTCGLSEASKHPEVYARARARARVVSTRAFDPELHAAPHGFFHAHDIGILLIRAIQSARQTAAWHEGPTARRSAIRDALYTIDEPVEGLLKSYTRPFSPVSARTSDGHEALGSDDLCMTTVDSAGHIASLDVR